MDYKAMLKKGRKELPESVFEKERFEVPKVRGHLQGNKTIISNFKEICQVLGRQEVHVLKYILKELATPGEIRGAGLILGAKVPASRVNEKIKNYAHEYVLCQECGKPDTKIEAEAKGTFLRCTACGARYSIQSRI